MRDRAASWFKNLVPLYLYTGGLLGGMILGWPQIFNTLRFFKYITRSDVIRFEYLQVLDLVRYALPDFNIFKLTRQEFLPYIGIVSLLLILVAVWRQFRTHRLVSFSAVSALLFLSLMVAFSPTALIMAHVPVFRYFAQPERWLCVANMFLALLAGIGLDGLRESTPEQFGGILKRIKKVCYAVLVAVMAANVVFYTVGGRIISFAQKYFDTHLYAATSHLPLEYYHGLVAVLVNQVFYNFSFLNPNVILFLAVLIAMYFLVKKYQGQKILSQALLILLVVNLLAAFFINTKFADASLIFKKPELQDFILAKEPDIHSFRVFSYLVTQAQYQKITALFPDQLEEAEKLSLEGFLGNINGVSLVGGLEANADKKVQQIVYFYLNGKSDNFNEKIPLLSMMNGKYIVTPYEISSKDLALATSTLVTKFNVPLYLYENKKVLPRIYLAKNVKYLTPEDDVKNLATVKDPSNDFSNLSYIECAACDGRTIIFSPKDLLTTTQYTDEKIDLDATIVSGRWLILSMANVLGWNAYIDGQKTDIYPANYILQAIYIPPGTHKIEFKYETKWW